MVRSKTKVETALLTNRTENLGYGYSHETIEVWSDGIASLEMIEPSQPSVIGTLQDVEDELDRAHRDGPTKDRVDTLFLNGMRIVHAIIVEVGKDASIELEDYENVAVAVVEALRSGAVVRVSLEDVDMYG